MIYMGTYRIVADVLAEHGRLAKLNQNKVEADAAVETIRGVVSSLADEFEADDASFDRDVFIEVSWVHLDN